MIGFVAQRGEQVVGMLLSTMPLAERMLFYNLAMTAMVMLPSSTLSRATKAGAPYLALFWRDVGNLTNLDAAYLPTKKRREMWDIRETGYRITT